MRALVAGIFALVCVATFSIGFAPPAGACSCMTSTDQEALERVDAAFVGTLVDVIAPTGALVGSADPERFVFEVDEVFKGAVTARQTVVTPRDGASCGLELAGPGPHLVFATEDPELTSGAEEGELYSHLCSGTRAVADGAVPDSFVGSPPAPSDGDPGATGSGTETSAPAPDGEATSPWVPIAVAAGVLVLVAAAVWRLRA